MNKLNLFLKALFLVIALFYLSLISISYSSCAGKKKAKYHVQDELKITEINCNLFNKSLQKVCIKKDDEIYLPYNMFLMKKFDVKF